MKLCPKCVRHTCKAHVSCVVLRIYHLFMCHVSFNVAVSVQYSLDVAEQERSSIRALLCCSLLFVLLEFSLVLCEWDWSEKVDSNANLTHRRPLIIGLREQQRSSNRTELSYFVSSNHCLMPPFYMQIKWARHLFHVYIFMLHTK